MGMEIRIRVSEGRARKVRARVRMGLRDIRIRGREGQAENWDGDKDRSG